MGITQVGQLILKGQESLLDQYWQLRYEEYPWYPNFVRDMINYYRQEIMEGYDREMGDGQESG
tara:strand:- start:314 stop:502 length:189 start_codon:yes stop_codon:yes gene_type:complete